MAGRLSDIANYAGVSVATVSRVLNDRDGVSEAARQSVLTAVGVLGYSRPTSLQSRAVGLIGVSVAELTNPIFPAYVQAIERTLHDFGYSQLLSTRHLGRPAEQASIDLLKQHGVSGMIFISGIHSDSTAETAQYHELRRTGMPLAFINGHIDGFDATFVSDDDVTAMDLAVRHLAALGHTHIGLAVGPTRYVPAARKRRGFHEAMHRLAPGGTAEEHVTDYSVEGGHVAGAALIQRGCTAVIAASDFVALGVIRAARSRGLDVPGDISVIGYDGSAITAFTDPPLTTIQQPVDAIAQAAVRSLVEEIGGAPPTGTELLFTPELIVRNSTSSGPQIRAAIHLSTNGDPTRYTIQPSPAPIE
jgi:LacI family transcriptional regulator, repressor for deo operon, udp, cdd, tsx, nupC, and nupG